MAAGEADGAGPASAVPADKDMVMTGGGPYSPTSAVSAGKDVTVVGTGGGPHGPAAPPAGPPAGKGGATEANSIDAEAVGSTAWTEVVTGPAAG